MGFFIKNNQVLIDHSIPEHANTTLEGNPSCYQLDSVKVYCIFERLPTKNRREHQQGDNAPFLYAIKGINNLWVDNLTQRGLYRQWLKIIPSLQKEFGHVDLILPMPSSYDVAMTMAKALCKKLSGAKLLDDALEKRTLVEVKDSLLKLNLSKDEHRKLETAIKYQMRIGGSIANFSLKNIPIKLRKYTPPIKLKGLHSVSSTKLKILLVDDLVSSGVTLECAAACIRDRYPNADIVGVSLFSPLKRHKKISF